jgi:hypothetical protein
MTTFDDDLHDRLARLDAAMPEPAAPAIPTTTKRSISRRRQGIVLVAAAVLFLSLAAIATVASQPDTTAEDEARAQLEQAQVDKVLDGAFADGCYSVDQATQEIRERLDAAGMQDWTIRATESTSQATCVGAAYSGDPKEIYLLPSMGAPLANALEDLKTDMRATCFDRAAAVAQVQAVLDANGQGDRPIEIHGMAMLPLDDPGYEAWVKGGCYVFESSQWDSVGRRTYFIAGP